MTALTTILLQWFLHMRLSNDIVGYKCGEELQTKHGVTGRCVFVIQDSPNHLGLYTVRCYEHNMICFPECGRD